MNITKKIAIATVLGMASLGVAVGASQAATGSAQPQGLPTDYIVTTNHAVTEAGPGGVGVTVANLHLRPGNWLVSWHATVVNFDSSDFVRCNIQAGSAFVGGATSLVGVGTASGAQGDGALVATLSNAAGFFLSSTTTVSLVCYHDTTGPLPYVDQRASLIAHKAKNLNISTQ